MKIKELIIKNRSCRRFVQEIPIPKHDLIEMVDVARKTPSAMNKQPIKYAVIHQPTLNESIFACTRWAGYLKEHGAPIDGERPSAYIVLLRDLTLSKQPLHDEGVIAQTILLQAVDKGYGGCIIGSVERDEIKEILELDGSLEVALVIALGVAKETHILEEAVNHDIHYYRDENGVHHVPKRILDDVLICMKSDEK